MKTAVGGADDNSDKYQPHGNHGDHRRNIQHEHVGGVHESEALGHNDNCPDCSEDLRKRRGL